MLDYESRFRDGVIDRFADEYARGRTPVPCSLCNQGVKFTDLIAFARELGADCLATGHYVRRVDRRTAGGVELHKGADPARDQSYFLYGTTREQLDYLRFPLGDLPKTEVRAARRGSGAGGRRQARQPGHLLRPRRRLCRAGQEAAAGNRGARRDRRSRRAGARERIAAWSISPSASAAGIEIGGQPEPLYVVRIEPEQQRLVVGPRRALAVEAMRVERLNWLGEDQREVASRCARWRRRCRRGIEGDWVRFAAARIWRRAGPGGGASTTATRLLGGGWIAENCSRRSWPSLCRWPVAERVEKQARQPTRAPSVYQALASACAAAQDRRPAMPAVRPSQCSAVRRLAVAGALGRAAIVTA